MYFVLKKESRTDRDKLYSVSIDVKNFPYIMPKYFKSMIILKSTENKINLKCTISTCCFNVINSEAHHNR